MKIDVDFLREVQKRGWQIERVGTDAAVVRCPMTSCGLRISVAPGKPLPTPPERPEAFVYEVTDLNQMRDFLQRRRRDLQLSLEDVEDSAGMTSGHMNKLEKPTPDRQPTLQTLVLWANALGMGVTLTPKGLTNRTLRILAETRQLSGRRQERQP